MEFRGQDYSRSDRTTAGRPEKTEKTGDEKTGDEKTGDGQRRENRGKTGDRRDVSLFSGK